MPCIEKLNYHKKKQLRILDILVFKIIKETVYKAQFNNLLSNMDPDTISNSSDNYEGISGKLLIDSSLTNTDYIHNLTKIDVTLWKAFVDGNLKQKTPWRLDLIVALDRLCQAHGYKNDSLSQRSYFKPLYGAIYRFEINPDLE